MAALQGSPRFTGFIRRLVEDGLVSAENMQNAVLSAKKANQDIVPFLIDQLKISSLDIAEKISQEFGEPLFDLSVYDSAQIIREGIFLNAVIYFMSRPAIQPIWMQWMRFASVAK